MTSPSEDGNPGSRIAILGEAPAKAEMAYICRLTGDKGKPLVGPSGRLFNWCLHQSGIARGECYILNVWPYEITKREHGETVSFYRADGQLLWNKKEGFTDVGRADAQRTLERLSSCAANVIVPLGEAALNLVSDKWQITKWRGSILESEALPGRRKILATRHPAASLRGDYALRYVIIADLKRALVQSRFPEIHLPQRELIIRPRLDDCLAWLKPHHGGAVATDIEVLNHQVSCFSIAWTPEAAICIPLADQNNQHYWSADQEQQIWQAYARLMGNPDITKINQNIAFDISHLLDKNHIHTRGRLCDPMIGFSLLHPWYPKGLDFLCSILTDEPYYKDDGKFWTSLDWSFDDLYRYNARDSALALECWQAIEPELEAKGLMETHDRTAAALPSMAYMMVRGLKVNAIEKAATSKRIGAEIEQLTEAFRERYDFNPASNKEIFAHFYDELRIKPYINPKTKKPTADDEALSRLWRTHGLQESKDIQQIRELSKFRGTYLEMLLDEDGRLRSSYNPRGTWTGRLSSSKTVHGYGGNAQNLAPEMRSYIEAG